MKEPGQDLLLSSPGPRVNEGAPDAARDGPGVPGAVQSFPLHPGLPPAGGAARPRRRAAPCTGRTSPRRPAAAGPILLLLKRCQTPENFVGEPDCTVNIPLGWGWGVAGAKRTSAVRPPSPAPERVSKRRNGDNGPTVRRPCSAGSPLTRELPSRAGRAGHGAGPFPSSVERKKTCLQFLGSERAPRAHPPSPSLFKGPATPAAAACVLSPRKQQCASAGHGRPERAGIAALRAPARRAGAADGTLWAPPASERGCPPRAPPRTLALPSPLSGPFPEN